MNRVRLIYVSRMTESCDMEAVEEILRVSRPQNAARDITGMLCYDPQYFLQCLEGPREAVSQLYVQISRDPRHTDILLLEYAETEDRLFSDWRMGFLKSSDLKKDTLGRFSKGGRFDPFRLSGAEAREFLVAIAAQERPRLEAQP